MSVMNQSVQEIEAKWKRKSTLDTHGQARGYLMILLFFPENGKPPDQIDIYDGINENQEQSEKMKFSLE